MPRLTPVAAALPPTVPFVGPETLERRRGAPFAARLGANESVFGPAPAAIEAMRAAAAGAWMYGDPEAHDLRAALAAHHGVPSACIVVGEGIDGLLGTLARLTIAPGTVAVTSDGAYPTFAYHVVGNGGTLVRVPYRDDREDCGALIAAAIRSDASLIYLANPDNPMGSWQSADAVAAMIARVPDGALLVLDEAYADTAPPGAIPPWDVADPRVVRMRTFSKAHGLAGLRVGYAVGHPDLIAAFDRVRNHFGVGRVAQAGALGALSDPAHLTRTVERIAAARARIDEIAAACGLAALPSATNFVAVDCGRNGPYAAAVLAALTDEGVFVRMPSAAPLDRCIRISAGTEADLDRLAAALPRALAAARS